eukprot:TRINITY_DN33056_c0_g1_i1.p1 TRINITY_DN33056_c0_g1~~TRINITY_DN33056_c0_g1_i1.p1  ORF type:complete len:2747 (+),score=558.46 TRINITY_DN33056_c0_g1_i1:885-8243(+)
MVPLLSVDLSQKAKDLLEPLAQDMFKVQDRRARARLFVQRVARKSTGQPGLMQGLAEAWAEAVKKTSKADEKQAMLMALAALVSDLDDGVNNLGKMVDPKGAIMKLANEDPNEETRVLAYKVIAALLRRVPVDSQSPLVQELLKGFTDKKAPDRARVAVLDALLGAVPQRTAAAAAPWTTAVLDKVVPVLTLAATKPVQRGQSLLAWAVCGGLAAKEPAELASRLKKEHLAVLKDGGSFCNSVALILKASYMEAVSQTQAWRAILCGDIGGLPSLCAAAGPLLAEGGALKLPPCPFADVLPHCRTSLVLLAALHQGRPAQFDGPNAADDKGVYRPSSLPPAAQLGLLDAVQAASEADAQALLLLLAQGLVAWLAELAVVLPNERQVSSRALRGILVDLCAAAAALKASVKVETLALLALAAHHRLLGTAKWPTGRLWIWLCNGPLAAVLKSASISVWCPLRAIVFNARLLPASDKTGFRSACVRLAGALDLARVQDSQARAALGAELVSMIDQCTTALHSEDVAKEKEKQVSIFFAPEGQLWRAEGTYVAEERENKNLKANKYLKSLCGDDESFYLEKKPAPKPAAAKPGGKLSAKGKAKAGAKSGGSAEPGSMTAEELQAATIVEQSETRARIRLYVDEAHYVLEVLAVLSDCDANSEIFEKALPRLMLHFMMLLKSPLTALRTRRAMRVIVRQVVTTSSVLRRDFIPDALLVVAKGWLLRSPAAAGTPGDTNACEEVLSSVVASRVLPTPALTCILPLILQTLATGLPALQSVCSKALLVLEKQLVMGSVMPECTVPQMLDALGVALRALPSVRVATQAALKAASKHSISTEEQLEQLANMFFNEESMVRGAVIAALHEVQHNELVMDGSLDASSVRAVLRLGALDAATKDISNGALEALGFDVDEGLCMELIDYAQHKVPSLDVTLQELVAKAVAAVLEELDDDSTTHAAMDRLMQLFREDAPSRLSVARCLSCVFASCLSSEEVIRCFRFLLRQALGLTSSDTAEAASLRDVLLGAGSVLVEKHGQDHADAMYASMEEFEDSAAGAAAGESARLGVAVFLGGLSKHLGANHPKVPEIVPRLLQKLLDPGSTTSVQDAIVKVMPPLMKQNKEQAAITLVDLLGTALEKKTAEVTRRGAAMGLGATVKGLSIQAVSQHGILKRIEEAAEDKKDAHVRQGALLCLEGLTLNLGRLFDPYVVSSLPLLLRAFSDSSQNVRVASQSAARVMMAQLSGPGVKQVLKPLMEGIKDKQYRTRLGSIELLATMTNCLPKQLAACLPQVVPALCTVINDQHAKVKEAARDALDRIGSIITSPELRALAPELIEALTDGAEFEHITKRVLDQLLGTSFVHHIDAPSLSLVCPLVQRALKQRSAEMKIKGGKIVGSMVLLIKDAKDIQPYLPLLLPQLKETLVDPIPDVRKTAAKAFGTLANGLPEEMLGDTRPWMFNMLRTAESAVERSGAANGLSEVLMAMGTERIAAHLPDILENASDRQAPPESREGYLGLFVYLPIAMGASFEPYIEDVLETLLCGIADDNSGVRETAFGAAQEITRKFGASYTKLLLKPLEEGIFDIDWRIRHASVQLLGMLIDQILRAHRIPTTNADLMFCEQLPREWREHFLVSLIIVRSDENPVVKQACAQTWKAVVQNTPRTLKELLASLMTRLIENLASTSREKQRVAARCVGDLAGKLGERVMPELMPIFMDTLSTGDGHVREGVCTALSELIKATTKQLLVDYLDELIPAIQQAIIDDVENVRVSASEVVTLLHSSVGSRATTDIVTWVLDQLLEDEEDDDEEQGDLFLAGLEQLVSKQPGAVVPIMLGKLTEVPEGGWTALQLRGLATISAVPNIQSHLSEVMPVMIQAAADPEASDNVREAALRSACRIVDAVDQSYIHMLFDELIKAVQDKFDDGRRAASARLFAHYFENTPHDVVEILPLALPAILPTALGDDSDEALAAGVSTLNAIVKKCKKEELAPYIGEVRAAVRSLIIDPDTQREDSSKMLPGLCNHNGLEPLYPIFQHVLVYGSSEARELAAKGLGEIVDHISEAAAKPYVVKITGPLIRIVGDRLSSTVKKAIVDTLRSLLLRGGATLKPILPQLQITYVKCMTDPSEQVRQKAAVSLGALARLSARTEPLINELCTGATTNIDEGFRLSMCQALSEVLLNVPTATGETTQEKLLDALVPRALGDEVVSECDREAAAWALAIVLRRHVPVERAVAVLKDMAPALTDSSSVDRRHGAARTLAGLCWCQSPQLPPPPEELLQPIEEMARATLPKLVGNADTSLQIASAALLAGLARLLAETSKPLDPIKAPAEKLASMLASGKMAPEFTLPAIYAARHVGAAAAKANSQAPACGCAALAAALAARGTGNSEQVCESAESALATIFAVPHGAGEAGAKAAMERLMKAMEGKAAAQKFHEYASNRLKALSQPRHADSFVWDFNQPAAQQT